jgi:YfiH family protein
VTLAVIAPPQPLAPAIHALTTTRSGGVSTGAYASLNLGNGTGDDPAAVQENRRRLLAHCGCARIQWLRQVHGARCVRVTAEPWDAMPQADAAWTDEQDVALAVLTADCVPVVVAAPRHGIVGIAHAGWRGLVGGVIGALVAALPVAASELVAWLGPAIGPADYQVDRPLVDAIAGLPDGARLVATVLAPDAEPARWRLDLFALATALLERAGIGEVTTDRINTRADARCWSHRGATAQGVPAGRMATVVWRSQA